MTTMEGYVSSEPREPRLNVEIFDRSGGTIPLDVVVDTGFTGFMTLPDDIITACRLRQNRNSRLRLADGRIGQFESYLATILWHGKPVTISALAISGTPLIGMSLLWNSEVAISARENGRVSVSEIAETP